MKGRGGKDYGTRARGKGGERGNGEGEIGVNSGFVVGEIDAPA